MRRKKMSVRASKKRKEEKEKLNTSKDKMDVAAAATAMTEMKAASVENDDAEAGDHDTTCVKINHVLLEKKPAAKIAMTDQEKKFKQEIVTPA